MIATIIILSFLLILFAVIAIGQTNKKEALKFQTQNMHNRIAELEADYSEAHQCNIENLKAAKAAGTRNIILLSVMILASLILCFHFIKKWWKSRAQK